MSDHPSWILLDFVSDTEDTVVKMADNYVNLPVNQPTFNWDCTNVIEEWKRFRGQVELLLVEGPYSIMNAKMKVATYSLIFPEEGPNKKECNKLEDVLDVFEAHFTPLQSMIHSWYNLGALHSHHCKDQSDFMSRLRNLAKECGFTNQDKVVKFLFLIHNSHRHVQDQLLKEITQASTINDCLQSARRVEAIIQSEKLTQKMHSNMGNSVSVDAFKKTKSGRGRGPPGGCGHGGRGGARGGYC